MFDDTDDIVDSWEQIVNGILDQHCPWREKRIKRSNQAPWITKPVLKQLQTSDYLLKVARRTDNIDDWKKYCTAGNNAGTLIRLAKREFYSNTLEDNKNK